MKRWLLKRTKIDTAAMARDLGIRRATAAVLANRELSSRTFRRQPLCLRKRFAQERKLSCMGIMMWTG